MDRVSKRILKAVVELDGERLTPEVLAKRAGCPLQVVYRRLQDDEFRSLFLETVKYSLSPHVPEIMGAFLERAKAGEFKHGKLLLEIAGVYTDEKKVTGDFTLREGEMPFRDPEAKARFAETTLRKLEGGS